MIGKAVKLAEGHLNTHSHEVTMNQAFLQELADEAQIPNEKMRHLNMARELWDILSPSEMQRFAHVLIQHAHSYCDTLLPNGHLDILLISEKGEILRNVD